MDILQAIQFAQIVAAAEAVSPDNLANMAGQNVAVNYDTASTQYKVITTIYGNDLATEANLARGNRIVSFGLVLQAPNNDVVIAIRGTDGIWEWVQDARFLYVKCPFLAGAGCTEDGFTAVYQSLRISPDTTSPRLVDELASPTAIAFNKPIGKVTVCGHSLGASIATLLALDIASNTALKDLTVYTFASPRTGNPLFASTYNQVVPNTFRVANRLDLVPKLPLPPLYEHVDALYEVTPSKNVRFNIPCEHHLTTYLFLMSLIAGKAVLPLNPECDPAGIAVATGTA